MVQRSQLYSPSWWPLAGLWAACGSPMANQGRTQHLRQPVLLPSLHGGLAQLPAKHGPPEDHIKVQ